MSTIALVILGALAGSVIWILVLAWCLDRIRAQRKQLASQETTLRLYRMMRDDSDRQVRDLLGQNGRLAAKMIELAAREAALASKLGGVESVPVFHAIDCGLVGRES